MTVSLLSSLVRILVLDFCLRGFARVGTELGQGAATYRLPTITVKSTTLLASPWKATSPASLPDSSRAKFSRHCLLNLAGPTTRPSCGWSIPRHGSSKCISASSSDSCTRTNPARWARCQRQRRARTVLIQRYDMHTACSALRAMGLRCPKSERQSPMAKLPSGVRILERSGSLPVCRLLKLR